MADKKYIRTNFNVGWKNKRKWMKSRSALKANYQRTVRDSVVRVVWVESVICTKHKNCHNYQVDPNSTTHFITAHFSVCNVAITRHSHGSATTLKCDNATERKLNIWRKLFLSGRVAGVVIGHRRKPYWCVTYSHWTSNWQRFGCQ